MQWQRCVRHLDDCLVHMTLELYNRMSQVGIINVLEKTLILSEKRRRNMAAVMPLFVTFGSASALEHWRATDRGDEKLVAQFIVSPLVI